jgi:hypothetical protein
MGSSGVTGVEVGALNGVGSTVAGRSASGSSAAKGLKEGLDSASGSMGHPIVSAAITGFVNNHVLDASGKLGTLLTSAGHNISNVAATARASDEQGAADLKAGISGTTSVSARINGQI